MRVIRDLLERNDGNSNILRLCFMKDAISQGLGSLVCEPFLSPMATGSRA